MTRHEAWKDYWARMLVSGLKASEGMEALALGAFSAGWRSSHAVSEPVKPEAPLQSPGNALTEDSLLAALVELRRYPHLKLKLVKP